MIDRKTVFCLAFLTTLVFETESTLHRHHLPFFAGVSSNTVQPVFVTVLVGLDHVWLNFSLKPKNSKLIDMKPSQSKCSKHHLSLTKSSYTETH